MKITIKELVENIVSEVLSSAGVLYNPQDDTWYGIKEKKMREQLHRIVKASFTEAQAEQEER